MEATGGKWVSLDEYAHRKGISKGTVYKQINRGDIVRRIRDGAIEIFVSSIDAPLFEQDEFSYDGEMSAMNMDFDFPEGGDYGIAAQSIRTLLNMHKQVLAEKHRMLTEWESELSEREARTSRLESAIEDRDRKIGEKQAEIRRMRKALELAEEMRRRLEDEIEDLRESLRQLNEIRDSEERDWERLSALIDEKDDVIAGKDEVIRGIESSQGQTEFAMRESKRMIDQLTEALQKSTTLLREKEEIIETIKAEPTDLDGKLAARDGKIEELKGVIATLRKEIDMLKNTGELTGFDQDDNGMADVIQDELEYIMAVQSVDEAEEEARTSIAPEGDEKEIETTDEGEVE